MDNDIQSPKESDGIIYLIIITIFYFLVSACTYLAKIFYYIHDGVIRKTDDSRDHLQLKLESNSPNPIIDQINSQECAVAPSVPVAPNPIMQEINSKPFPVPSYAQFSQQDYYSNKVHNPLSITSIQQPNQPIFKNNNAFADFPVPHPFDPVFTPNNTNNNPFADIPMPDPFDPVFTPNNTNNNKPQQIVITNNNNNKNIISHPPPQPQQTTQPQPIIINNNITSNSNIQKPDPFSTLLPNPNAYPQSSDINQIEISNPLRDRRLLILKNIRKPTIRSLFTRTKSKDEMFLGFTMERRADNKYTIKIWCKYYRFCNFKRKYIKKLEVADHILNCIYLKNDELYFSKLKPAARKYKAYHKLHLMTKAKEKYLLSNQDIDTIARTNELKSETNKMHFNNCSIKINTDSYNNNSGKQSEGRNSAVVRTINAPNPKGIFFDNIFLYTKSIANL